MIDLVRWNIPILVARQTDTELVLRTRWHPGVLLSLLFTLSMIYFVSMLTVSWTTLTCNRTKNILHCDLAEFKLIGKLKIRDIPLKQLQKATVESKMYDNKINTPHKVHRVMLWTSEGSEPLTPSFTTDWAMVRDDKAKINDFIGNLEQSSLKIEPDFWSYVHEVHGVFNWLYGLTFIAFIFLFCMPRVFCTFDKNSGRVKIKRIGTRLIFDGIQFEGYIRDIKDVFVEEPDGGFRVSLLLDNGVIEPLILTCSPGTKGKQKAVATIREFLELTPRKNSQYIKRVSGNWASWDVSPIVERQTDTELVLRTKRSPGLVGYSLLIIGSFLILTTTSTRLTCNRVEPNRANCELAEFKIMGQLKTKETPLSSLPKATIKSETRQDEDGSYEVYHVLLWTPQGFERLTPNFLILHQPTAIATAAKINNFTKNSQQLSLEIETNLMTQGSFVAGIFGLVGGVMFSLLFISCTPKVELKFNKDNGRATIKQDATFGCNKQNFECSIRKIEDIVVEEYDGPEVGFRVSLRLKNGKVKPLFDTYSPGLKSKQKTVEIIKSFLELNSKVV